MDCNLRILVILAATELQPDADKLAGVRMKEPMTPVIYFL
jgi:hypothetical protein